ncbi:type II CAAX prenyl endopeptidase Rce1 family protein [Candidatus Manganitrophus noduliformans]|uniref:CPBP family intramembrane metalloprotease n=1 Tax=Candidatus Manganitrophus noduliformans TaxID=2606439 RepID=A0A7X6IBF8_9BACT|nr:CPBP family glutamic-type intramembrane protease [Candidatus Manganitrophus noduliformans]NKE71364.1 CPBP family intramembrane metalloprotease [Candidatus Manganitrophus noduliformans]
MFLDWRVWLFFLIYFVAVVLFLKRIERGPAPAESEVNREEFKNVSVSAGELILGIFLPFLLNDLVSFVASFSFSKMPWRLVSLNFWVPIVFSLVSLLYALIVCKKGGLWPLFRSTSPPTIPPMLLKGFFLACATSYLVGVSYGGLEWIFQQKPQVRTPPVFGTFAPNGLMAVLHILAKFTIIPLVEEIYFRGFLYNVLKTRLPMLAAAVLQAILFGAAHRVGFLGGILYFLFGMVFVAAYETRKKLIFPVLVHGFISAIALMPALIMEVQNFHMPASNWEEAQTTPAWIESVPPAWVKKKEDGMKQWQYAIDTWGSQGSKRWKQEINAFNAVCTWFPEDRTACAKAKIGIVWVYFYLNDYRRSVIEADRLIQKYPDQEEQVAAALLRRGIGYLLLQELEKSRSSFERVLNEFSQFEKPRDEAERRIKWLNGIEWKGTP